MNQHLSIPFAAILVSLIAAALVDFLPHFSAIQIWAGWISAVSAFGGAWGVAFYFATRE